VRTADNFFTLMCRLSRKFGNSNLLEPSPPVQAGTGMDKLIIIV